MRDTRHDSFGQTRLTDFPDHAGDDWELDGLEPALREELRRTPRRTRRDLSHRQLRRALRRDGR